MSMTTLALIVVAELALLLLGVCIFLLFHLRRLRRRMHSQGTDAPLRGDEAAVAPAPVPDSAQDESEQWLDALDARLDATRDHHLSLRPDRDIVLDLTADSDPERRVASLRHAFLVAEKEAALMADGEPVSWSMLNTKLGQLLAFIEEAAQASSAATPQSQADDDSAAGDGDIDVLRQAWTRAREQAERDYHALLEHLQAMEGSEVLQQWLSDYDQRHQRFGEQLQSGAAAADDTPPPPVSVDTGEPRMGQRLLQQQEEIRRLHNMAADQFREIDGLRKRLEALDDADEEERSAMTVELTTQLEQLSRYLKESETCTTLLEEELSRAAEENRRMETELRGLMDKVSGLSSADVEQLQDLVAALTEEGRRLLQTVGTLAEDNSALRAKVDADVADADESAPRESGDDLLDMELLDVDPPSRN